MNCHLSDPPRQADPSPVRPFASLPHDIAGDPRLTPTDLAVLLALLFWCRSRAFCFPSDPSIGRRIGRSAATVQRRLKALEALGIIRREKTDRNPTGRIIVLCWREEAPSSMRDPLRSPVRDEGNRVVQEKQGSEKAAIPETTRSEPPAISPPPVPPKPPSPSGPLRGPVRPRGALNGGSMPPTFESVSQGLSSPLSGIPREVPREVLRTGGSEDRPKLPPAGRKRLPKLDLETLARLAPSDPILAAELSKRTAPRPEAPPNAPPRSTPELIERLRESASYPPMLAHALTVEFHDQGSYMGFLRIALAAWRGEIDLGDLADAYRQGSNPAARKPGAVFMHAINRFTRRAESHTHVRGL